MSTHNLTTRAEVAKHTPLPWGTLGELGDLRIVNDDSENPDACDGVREVAQVKQGDYEIPNYGEAEANAALIVRAVNNHASLLAALEKVLALKDDESKGVVIRLPFSLEAEIQHAIKAATL